MATVLCPKCTSETSSKAKYCDQCGSKLASSDSSGSQKPIINSSDLNALINDSKEESWRQNEAILKLSDYHTEESINTLFSLAFSDEEDPHDKMYGRKSKPKYNSKVRWTAVESISKMGDYAKESTLSFLQDRLKLIETYKESKDRSRVYNTLFVDMTMLIWLAGELRNQKSIGLLTELFYKGDSDAMGSLLKFGIETKDIFIKYLENDDIGETWDNWEERYVKGSNYYWACTSLASFGEPIIPDLLKNQSIEKEILIADILNHLHALKFNEEILLYYLELLSEHSLVIKSIEEWTSDNLETREEEVYTTNAESITLYGKIRTALLSSRDKTIAILNNQKNDTATDKIGLIRAMGLMDDAMFLQPLISFSQDPERETREEALKWYKRLNHKNILYQDSSNVPEMASFSDDDSFVDMTQIEFHEFLEKRKEKDFKEFGNAHID
ncbi:MAG: hypothetical protein HN936_05590 [Bacteroidetes bacterium]|jgi:hypothetical protein|nr:hypothetical protein [Bacteroidota bacterium]